MLNFTEGDEREAQTGVVWADLCRKLGLFAAFLRKMRALFSCPRFDILHERRYTYSVDHVVLGKVSTHGLAFDPALPVED